MQAFLQDERRLRIHVDKWFYEGRTGDFFLHADGQKHELPVDRTEEQDEAIQYYVTAPEAIEPGREYMLFERYGSRCPLLISGEYVRSPAFDQAFAYDGDDLGPVYTKKSTTFKLWAPLARRVLLLEYGEHEKAHVMTRGERGVWSVKLNQDCDGMAYTYWVDNISQIRETLDPYAISSTANGRRSFVVDRNKLEFKIDKSALPAVGGLHELVTYEVSVRDYTYQHGLSTFDGMVEHFDYIASLGITNLQLLPVYDFFTVNEEDRFARYNWGYDPFNYNVLDGSFVTDPNGPYARLNAFGRLIQHANSRGIRLTMDVVYNHLYDAEAAPYNQIVPGYFTRYHEDGSMSNGSFCGNDFRSEGAMVRKFIVDSVRMYSEVLGVDGYRFDLMGDMDIETMNAVKAALGPDVLVYGEGWNMPSALPEPERACIENQERLPEIGHFNDRFRNAMKGQAHGQGHRGLALGTHVEEPHLADLLRGSPHIFSDLSKSLNYIECHDNHTFYDWLVSEHQIEDEAAVRAMCSFGLATVLLSFGAPFVHAGQEFMRTKNGVENSYNASDEINQFDWARIEQHADLVDFLRTLIRYRAEKPHYRLSSVELAEQVTIDIPATNVAVIKGDGLLVLMNFSGEDIQHEAVTAELNSNLPIEPGVLKSLQVCFG